jgi:hypothetical protein
VGSGRMYSCEIAGVRVGGRSNPKVAAAVAMATADGGEERRNELEREDRRKESPQALFRSRVHYPWHSREKTPRRK